MNLPLERMDLMPDPKVTVLMSVYNGEKYLREAIDSILNQTFPDFEFIIINDGSTDSSLAIIKAFNDPRIISVNQENMGLAKSLNKGINMARGEYIARMDADDVSLPQRLERQVIFMDTHAEIGGCGSWIRFIGDKKSDVRFPTRPEMIKSHLFLINVIAHPSVMIRTKLFMEKDLYYNPSLRHSQDYDLWIRASRETQLANIGEILLLYRVHKEQAGQAYYSEQIETARQIWPRQLEELGISPTPQDLEIHDAVFHMKLEHKEGMLPKIEEWLPRIKASNRENGVYPEPFFSDLIDERLTSIRKVLLKTKRRDCFLSFFGWKS